MIQLIILYSISNFLLLLNRGIYWDGWYWLTLLKNQEYETIWNLASQARLYNVYYLLRFLELGGHPVLAVKALTFLSWLIAGLCLYGILKKKFRLPQNHAFFLSASFFLVPVFLVKIDQSILQYSVNNLLFFLAAFLYISAERNEFMAIKYLNYLAAGILFFLSFITNSFLVFYYGLLAFFFLAFRQENKNSRIKPLLLSWTKTNLIFIFLPIIFWVTKWAVGQPIESSYSDYNQFVPLTANLALYIQNLWQNIVYGFFWPIVAPFGILPRKIFSGILLITAGLFYFLAKNILSEKKDGEDSRPREYLAAGLFLFALGVIPYLLVGKAPHVFGNGFSMRHTLLLPLGSSLIILGTILAVIKERWQPLVQIILLSLFSTFTIYNYYWQDLDWYKQQAVIEALKEIKNESVKNASVLIFNDRAGVNWQNRNVRGEEYQGYLIKAFPRQQMKFAATEGYDPIQEYWSAVKSKTILPVFPPDFDPAKKVVAVDIISKATREIPTVRNWLKIKKSEIFSGETIFLNTIKDIYRLEIIPSITLEK